MVFLRGLRVPSWVKAARRTQWGEAALSRDFFFLFTSIIFGWCSLHSNSLDLVMAPLRCHPICWELASCKKIKKIKKERKKIVICMIP